MKQCHLVILLILAGVFVSNAQFVREPLGATKPLSKATTVRKVPAKKTATPTSTNQSATTTDASSSANDPLTVPQPTPTVNEGPSLTETLDFIKSKLPDEQSPLRRSGSVRDDGDLTTVFYNSWVRDFSVSGVVLVFSQIRQTIAKRNIDGSRQECSEKETTSYTIDLSKLDPSMGFSGDRDDVVFVKVRPIYTFGAVCADGKTCVARKTEQIGNAYGCKTNTVRDSKNEKEFFIEVTDEELVPRLQKALDHAIVISGGKGRVVKKEPF